MLRPANRTEMLAHMPKNGRVAEVGVWVGDYAQQIIIHNSPRELVLIDSWAMQPAEVYDDPINTSEQLTWACNVTMRRFANNPVVTIMRQSSLLAAESCGMFDWVYIDANHGYDAVLADLRAWSRNVKPGGWLCGHDYYEGTPPRPSVGVRRAVHEFLVDTERSLDLLTCEDDAQSYGIRI